MRRRNFLQSRNPVMKEQTYMNSAQVIENANAEKMTVSGAVNKTFLLALIMLATATYSFSAFNPIFVWVGAIGGLIAVLVASFRPNLSPTLAPVYAGLEGLFVGGISYMYAGVMNGIIFQAVTLTLAVLFMMLFIYRSGIIKVTEKFRMGVFMATGAIFLVYMLNFVLAMFGINLPFLHEGGMVGIGISLVIIGVAALNLLLDFDNFEKGEKYGAPKYMEWFSAMGLIITLVWLYVEILRLLAILSSND
ncbi:MAG: Bax inhibitor-1/YccA family protein [Bacteroidota bacterium]